MNYSEKEVQERVRFKLEQLLTAVENRAAAEWSKSFNLNSQKHANYWEAFKELKAMLNKEIDMPVPEDNMAEKAMKLYRDQAVERLLRSLDVKRGEQGYDRKVNVIIHEIENALNW